MPRVALVRSVLAVAGIALALTGCGQITPVGPARGNGPTTSGQSTPVPFSKLGSPIILQVMRSESPTPAGGCAAGLVAVFLPPGAAPMPCFRPVGAPVAVTTAAVSPVSTSQSAHPPGKPAQPTSYGFMVGVPASQVAAVTALIRQAYDARSAIGVSVDGKLWQAAQVLEPFPGQQFQVMLLTRNQALQLYRLLVPSVRHPT